MKLNNEKYDECLKKKRWVIKDFKKKEKFVLLVRRVE